jgi:hypothetical protein
MIHDWLIEKDMEGSGRSLIQVLYGHSSLWPVDNHEKPQDNLCPGKNSNQEPPKYKSVLVPLHQPADCILLELICI